jgi:hypothetical protein
MVIGILYRIEEGILIMLTHTNPVQRINLPHVLFLDLEEGDMIEKNHEITQEQRDRIFQIRGELNKVEL